MPPAEARSPAPLSVWYTAVALAAAAWAVAWFAATRGGAQLETPFTRFNRDRIASFDVRAAASGARRVILLGSSALKYATRDEGEFAARIAKAVKTPVAALRVSSNWGTFYDFAPLAADILRARPDVVVMESEFLAADRPPAQRFLLWVQQLRQSLGLDKNADRPDDEAKVQFGYPCWSRRLSRDHEKLLEVRSDWVTVRPDGPGPRSARDFAEALLDDGAQVVFVSIPRRPDYELEARRTRAAANEGEAGRRLSVRVQHWEPAPVPATLYCDLTHVTPAGQARVSDWLESSIARAIAPAS